MWNPTSIPSASTDHTGTPFYLSNPYYASNYGTWSAADLVEESRRSEREMWLKSRWLTNIPVGPVAGELKEKGERIYAPPALPAPWSTSLRAFGGR